jgi:hypothetical protein
MHAKEVKKSKGMLPKIMYKVRKGKVAIVVGSLLWRGKGKKKKREEEEEGIPTRFHAF